MLGGSIKSHLDQTSHKVFAPPRSKLDLLDFNKLCEYVKIHNFDLVIHCAARVGGIAENISFPYEMISQNLRIDSNIFEAALNTRIPSFLYFGSSCAYPKDHTDLLSEAMVLTGTLEPTNEGYALAKIMGMKTVEAISNQYSLNWRTFVLSNLYGPGDKFNSEKSHLLASIIAKVAAAKNQAKDSVEMWGNGEARREFTYVGDVSKFVVENVNNLNKFPSYMNLGIGIDFSVREYYEEVISMLAPNLKIEPNLTRATGMKKKLMDSTIARNLGWNPKTDLRSGLRETIDWYLATKEVTS